MRGNTISSRILDTLGVSELASVFLADDVLSCRAWKISNVSGLLFVDTTYEITPLSKDEIQHPAFELRKERDHPTICAFKWDDEEDHWRLLCSGMFYRWSREGIEKFIREAIDGKSDMKHYLGFREFTFDSEENHSCVFCEVHE